MKKYYYQNAMNPKKYLNCQRSAPEWVNQDLPYIHRVADDSVAVEVTFPQYRMFIYARTNEEADQLEKFVRNSTGDEATDTFIDDVASNL